MDEQSFIWLNIHSGEHVTRSSDDALQEHLIKVRKNQILDAATQVFAVKGFHRATIRDVAKAAGVADGTIYNYFENKTALLLGLLDRLNATEERELHFAQSIGMDVASFVRMYFKQRFKELSESGLEIFNVLLSEVLVNQELRETYYRQIVEPSFATATPYAESWLPPGTEQRIDPQLMLRMITGMGLGVLMLRLMGDSLIESRWDEVPDVLAELILHGIAPQHGDHHATGTRSDAETGPNPTA
jgi:AcrR family transcriptional regulator